VKNKHILEIFLECTFISLQWRKTEGLEWNWVFVVWHDEYEKISPSFFSYTLDNLLQKNCL